MFNRFSSALGKRYTKQLTNTINTLSARYKSTISLANLKDNDGARYFPKQLGRGRSSGKGKTSTRGQKGYYARSGASGMLIMGYHMFSICHVTIPHSIWQ